MLEISNDYIGEIVNAELIENNGRVSAVIMVRPLGRTETARWFGSFSETVISRGDNQGRMVGEVTAETIGKFGCTDFAKISEIVGQKVAFGIKHKPGDTPGKVFVECNFVRPVGSSNPASPTGIASIGRFRGAAIEAAKKAPKPASKPVREPGDDVEQDPFA